jgi:protein SCO1/2
MAQLQTDLVSEPDIRLVSITVDPDHDTPAVLARYAGRFHADPRRWYFLTGEGEGIYHLAQDGFHLSAAVVPAVPPTPVGRALSGGPGRSAGPLDGDLASVPADTGDRDALVHDARFALVDRKARIRGYYSGLDPEAIARLRRDARTLLREQRVAAE